ncbi:2-hydroxyacid dehydrogenase [Propionibacteriaceae bacterium Y2011]
MLAWLPFADADDLQARIGGLPDGVEFEPATSGTELGASPDKVEFFVLPYLSGTAALDRIDEFTSLQVVQTQTAGYEDVLARIPDSVTLCNGAGIHDASTAEIAIALALANGRHLDDFARNQTSGSWAPQWGTSIADKRVLILGYGQIGKAIEARLAGFEIASITRVARTPRDGVRPVSELPELLPEADVVFVIAPHTPQTDKILDAAALALLPDGALVVNVARGKLVDTDALVAETSSGRLRAALDVTDPEPLPAGHPLWTIPGVTISPHIGGASSAFQPRADKLIKAQLTAWAAGEPLAHVVKEGHSVKEGNVVKEGHSVKEGTRR